MGFEDHDLCVTGLRVLIETLGNVEAERFVCLMNRGAGDYTEWRKTHLYEDETVESLAQKARETSAMYRSMRKALA